MKKAYLFIALALTTHTATAMHNRKPKKDAQRLIYLTSMPVKTNYKPQKTMLNRSVIDQYLIYFCDQQDSSKINAILKSKNQPSNNIIQKCFTYCCKKEMNKSVRALLQSQCISRSFVKKTRYYRKHYTSLFTDIDRLLRNHLRKNKQTLHIKNEYANPEKSGIYCKEKEDITVYATGQNINSNNYSSDSDACCDCY